MIRKIDSKKGDKLISVYWFAVLFIVATGIVVMVNAFYGSSYDVRKVEARILSQNVADCIYFGGKVNPKFFEGGAFRLDFKDNFLEKCSLKFDVKYEFERPPYYVQVEVFSEGDSRKPSFLIEKGNKNWKSDCSIKASGNKKLAKCDKREFFMKSSSDSYYFVKILSIVGKVEENVK